MVVTVRRKGNCPWLSTPVSLGGLETGLTLERRVWEGGMAGRAAQRTVVGKQGYVLGR